MTSSDDAGVRPASGLTFTTEDLRLIGLRVGIVLAAAIVIAFGVALPVASWREAWSHGGAPMRSVATTLAIGVGVGVILLLPSVVERIAVRFVPSRRRDVVAAVLAAAGALLGVVVAAGVLAWVVALVEGKPLPEAVGALEEVGRKLAGAWRVAVLLAAAPATLVTIGRVRGHPTSSSSSALRWGALGSAAVIAAVVVFSFVVRGSGGGDGILVAVCFPVAVGLAVVPAAAISLILFWADRLDARLFPRAPDRDATERLASR